MNSSVYQLIRDAILKKQQVIATYKRHRREMCPHVIGTKNGREKALFYQFGGTSSSEAIVAGSPDNWRCIFIDGLSEVTARNGEWHTANNHSSPQTCVDNVDVEVGM